MTNGGQGSNLRHIVTCAAVCYAQSMGTSALRTSEHPGNTSSVEARHEPLWRLLLAPRPFVVVSSLVYVAMLISLAGRGCVPCITAWQTWTIAVAYVGLLALDRLDYLIFGETPPRRAGLMLILVRILLIETARAIGGI